jgi:hypothetical protein
MVGIRPASEDIVIPTKIRIREPVTNVKRGRLRLTPYPRHKLSRHDYGYAHAPTQTKTNQIAETAIPDTNFSRAPRPAPRPRADMAKPPTPERVRGLVGNRPPRLGARLHRMRDR